MGKLTLIIEDTPIDFEIDQVGLYLYHVNQKPYFLKVEHVHEKGCTFRKSDHSSQSYWWDTGKWPLYICSHCEDFFDTPSTRGEVETIQREQHFCFSCALWTARAKGENPLVIDGVRYSLGPGNSGGMAGRKFVIEYFDGRVVETNDLWCQGEVPDWVRDRIPDTAKFLGGAYFDREVKAWQASR